MSNNFYVGQKVVCVNSKPGDFPICLLTEGKVYVVTEVGMLWDDPFINVEGAMPQGGIGFHACRFRPAVERGTETGMSILRKIAKGDLVPA